MSGLTIEGLCSRLAEVETERNQLRAQLSLWLQPRRDAQLRAQLAQAETERDRLHQLVCDARSMIDPEKHAEWDREANAEADRCELYIDTNQQLRAQLAQLSQWVRAHTTAPSGEVLCCCHGPLERYNATCTYCQGRLLLLADLPDAPKGEKPDA